MNANVEVRRKFREAIVIKLNVGVEEGVRILVVVFEALEHFSGAEICAMLICGIEGARRTNKPRFGSSI